MRIPVATLRGRVSSMTDEELEALAVDARKGVRALVVREQRRRDRTRKEQARLEGMLSHERELWRQGLQVAGVDEVGVGPLAGPVMAAAVVLPSGTSIPEINDSKLLDVETRERLADRIRAIAIAWGIGTCSRQEVDTYNIYQAAREAMRRAVVALSQAPDTLLVDARSVPRVEIPQRLIIKGDTQSQSIAAASIVAKVERDRWMCDAAKRYPGYGFESHKGYFCPQHVSALERLGPCDIHRRSFAPVAMHCDAKELAELEILRERAKTRTRQ